MSVDVQLPTGNNHIEIGDLFTSYNKLILSIAFKALHDWHEAEEVLQDVMTEIMQKLDQYDCARGTVKMWVLQYAYSRSINRYHALEKRRSKEEEIAPKRIDPETGKRTKGYIRKELIVIDDLSKTMELEERQARIREALNKLAAESRRVIEMIHFQGLTVHDVVNETGKTFDSVRSSYYRGVKQLQKIFNEGAPERMPNGSKQITSHSTPA